MAPRGWVLTTVGEACNIKNNLRLPINSDDRSKRKGDYPYFGPTGILGYIDEYRIDEEFVLIGEDGDHFLKFHEKEMTLLYTGKANVNNHAHIICKSAKCTTEWFHFNFVHRDITAHLTRQGAKRYKLTKAALERLPILIPPLSEQRKITQILSTWDQAIEAVEQLIANGQQQKKALMRQLFTGEKRFPGSKGKWEKASVKQMGRVVSGGTPDTLDSKYWNGNVLWTTPTDITALKSKYIDDTARKITASGIKDSSATLLPVGSLLVCTRATIGYLAINKKEITTNQGFKSIVPDKSYSVEFLYYLLSYFRHQLIRHSCGSTFLELSKKDFENQIFLVPEDLEEQMKIANFLASIDTNIETRQAQLTHLQQEKKALMQSLLTGKRRVTLEKKAA